MSTELHITITEPNATETASAFETLARSMGYVKQDTGAASTLDRVREALDVVHGQTVRELLEAWHLKVAAAIEAASPAPAPVTAVD